MQDRDITRHEGTPYQGRREGEERRDVYSAELDYGASIITEASEYPTIVEPVYTIKGSGEHRGGGLARDPEQWVWGVGTGLQVSRSSIPALMRVLSDLMEHEPTFE